MLFYLLVNIQLKEANKKKINFNFINVQCQYLFKLLRHQQTLLRQFKGNLNENLLDNRADNFNKPLK